MTRFNVTRYTFALVPACFMLVLFFSCVLSCSVLILGRKVVIAMNVPVLTDYYDVVGGQDFSLVTCKVCGRKTVVKTGDNAAIVRLLNHGLSHGGVQLPLPAVKR